MNTDLDTLATALFVKTDDLLKSSPQLAPWRPPVGITPQLSDAELATLAMMQAILGLTSGARWLRHAQTHLRHRGRRGGGDPSGRRGRDRATGGRVDVRRARYRGRHHRCPRLPVTIVHITGRADFL